MKKFKNIRLVLFSVLVAAFCLGITAVSGIAQEEAEQPEAEAMDKMHQEMMSKWKEYATPGESHKALDPMVGEWEYTVKWWNTPESEPEVSKGTSEVKWIMDGRFLKQKVQGTSKGKEFNGMGIMGYDNAAKEYKTVWIDDMGTGIMMSSGTYDASTRTFTEQGSYTDPVHGEKTYRGVTTIEGPDKYTYEMYISGPDGKEFRALEIVNTRKK